MGDTSAFSFCLIIAVFLFVKISNVFIYTHNICINICLNLRKLGPPGQFGGVLGKVFLAILASNGETCQDGRLCL